MYVSTMKCVRYPLALPLDFLDEFKQAAKEAGLSTVATIRQSAKLGLPKFREQTRTSKVPGLKPEVRGRKSQVQGPGAGFWLRAGSVASGNRKGNFRP